MNDAILEFSNVVKRFGNAVIINGLSFSVRPGEFFTLLGPSGCGKSTTLRLIAGLETPESGEITLDGRCLAAPERSISLPPDKRNVGMMFQSYAIWPHLTVFDNIAFPLRVRRQSADVIKSRVMETLDLVGLTGLENRSATQLSGGQQQRVALARAIIYTPRLLLLDEPLSNLDVKLREQMREELRALQRRLNLAVLYVTHDQTEAMSLSDRIAMVNKGRFEQVGTPFEIYEKPRTRFVGDFVGRTIIIKGTIYTGAGNHWVEVQDAGRIAVTTQSDDHVKDGAHVRVLCRPEDVTLLPANNTDPYQIVGKVEGATYMGDHLEYTIRVSGRSLVLPATKKERYAAGDDVRLKFDPGRVTVLS